MTVSEYLNNIEQKDEQLYQQIVNLQILTGNLGTKLNINKEQLKFLYDVCVLFFVEDLKQKEFKSEYKFINTIINYKNGQEVHYFKHLLELVFSICHYYNRLRTIYNHEYSLKIIKEYPYYPPILKNKFNEIFESDIFDDLDYSFYDLDYED